MYKLTVKKIEPSYNWFVALYFLFILIPIDTFPDFTQSSFERVNDFYYNLLICILINLMFVFRYFNKISILDNSKIFLPIILFVSYLFLNCFFSIDPKISFIKTISLINFLLIFHFSIYFFNTKENFIKYLIVFSFFAIIINYASIFLVPHLSMHGDTGLINGEWRGVLGHKNNAAPTMAFFILFSICLWQFKYTFLSIILFIFSFVFFYMTKGKGPLIALILTFMFLFCFSLFKNTFVRITIILIAITTMGFLTLGSIFYSPIEQFYLNNNIDATFTGRREVWEFMFEEIEKSDFFGYGFYAFWNRPNILQYLENTYSSMSWANNAHQVYLDIYAQLGMIGFICFLYLVFLVPLVDIFKAMKLGHDVRIIRFLASFWLFMLLAGFIDSNMFFGTPASFNLFMITIFLLRYLANFKWGDYRKPPHTNYQ